MKKINKYIIVCMLFSFCLSNTVAQTKGNISDIRSNWYIEVGAGAQVLFSADASKLSFGDRITPSISGGREVNGFLLIGGLVSKCKVIVLTGTAQQTGCIWETFE